MINALLQGLRHSNGLHHDHTYPRHGSDNLKSACAHVISHALTSALVVSALLAWFYLRWRGCPRHGHFRGCRYWALAGGLPDQTDAKVAKEIRVPVETLWGDVIPEHKADTAKINLA